MHNQIISKQSHFFSKFHHALIILGITTVLLMFSGNVYMQTKTSYLLPEGTEYVS